MNPGALALEAEDRRAQEEGVGARGYTFSDVYSLAPRLLPLMSVNVSDEEGKVYVPDRSLGTMSEI